MSRAVQESDAQTLDRARSLLRGAQRIVALTGAGVSAESGVPTFRGAGGLWRQYRAEDLATPQAFARDARLVWEWYGWRRSIVSGCAPNAAHHALAAAALGHPDFRIITQNVDGLHGRAAREPRAIPLELHGSLYRTRCTRCAHRWDDRSTVDATSRDALPHCDACGALARPDIVWFGEALDEGVLGEAMGRASNAEVCLVVGTSALVHPAAGLADLTRRNGGSVVEVNVADTPLTGSATVVLRGTAATIVPDLLAS
jgi:NAD-dependent deacetylase